MISRIAAILATCDTDTPLLPPTTLYNEGWLVRLVVDWFATQRVPGHPLDFSAGSRWFSEAWLPTPFPRAKGRPGEGWTHADALVGHFTIGTGGKAAASLRRDATHLVVLEAKLRSGLSKGVHHAPYYDQAARTVACMAELFQGVQRRPENATRIGFYVLAPKSRIALGVFEGAMDRAALTATVAQRGAQYGDAEEWHQQWFLPLMERIDLGVLAWEDVIATIRQHDASAGDCLDAVYTRCLACNG